MGATFAVLFVAIAAGCFYFLVHEDKVRSLPALRFAWIDLGLSLVTSSLWPVIGGESFLSGMLVSSAVAHFFLGSACICLVFAVHPISFVEPESVGEAHSEEASEDDPELQEIDEEGAEQLAHIAQLAGHSEADVAAR